MEGHLVLENENVRVCGQERFRLVCKPLKRHCALCPLIGQPKIGEGRRVLQALREQAMHLIEILFLPCIEE